MGTGAVSTENVVLWFGTESVQDCFFSVDNYGDERVRFLDIRIGDTRSEVMNKLNKVSYEIENAGLENEIYYLIWNPDADNPLVSLRFDIGYDTLAIG